MQHNEFESIGSPLTSPFTAEMKFALKWDVIGLRGDFAIISEMKDPVPNIPELCTPFQAGLSNHHQTTQLFIMSSGLVKMGLKILAVSCSHPGPGGNVALMEIVSQGNGLVQLFKHSFSIFLTEPTCFTFNVYLTGTALNYQPRLADDCQAKQLWRSAKLRHNTDLEFVVKHSLFSAHKVVLAARSPVFADMLSSGTAEARNNRIVIDDVSPSIFKHLLRFLYTGQFVIGCCHTNATLESLYTIAEKFQVETLKQLCQQARAYSLVTHEELTASLSDSWSTCLLPLTTSKAQKEEEKMRFEEAGSVLVFTWRLSQIGSDGKALVSKFFQYQNEDAFRAGMVRKPSHCMLYLASVNANKLPISVDNVAYYLSCSKDGDLSTYSKKRIFMRDEGGDHGVRRFTAQVDKLNRIPCYITFFVEIWREMIPYEVNMGDLLLPEQMLLAAQKRVFTDVTFRVGTHNFAAHRSVLSARSSVFETMFLVEDQLNTNDAIILEEMDPVTFEHLLHFLYTGQLHTSAYNGQLKAAAEKYKLNTLLQICAYAESSMKEDVTTSLFKCWVQTSLPSHD